MGLLPGAADIAALPLITATLAAPAIACLTLSPILSTIKLGPLDSVPFGAALLPMVFAVPGSILLALLFLLLGAFSVRVRRRYAVLLLASPFAGAAILGNYELVEILLGAFYAVLTAALWAVIHWWISARRAVRKAA
ncbi:MAG: hypothetical protein WA979_05220 [Pacificimonas sp.]